MLLVLLSRGACTPYARAAREAGANATMHKMIGFRKVLAIIEADMLEDEQVRSDPATLALNEFEYVASVYLANDRNAVKTARDLDIERATLYRKLRNKAPRR